MFGHKTAAALDAVAGALHKTGTKVAGQTGGRTADTVATATLGRLRDHCTDDSTRTDCDHD